MGGTKLDLAVGGRSLLERALAACGDLPVVIVSSPQLAAQAERALASRGGGGAVVVNDRPELGMSRSLQLADAALAMPLARLAVVPADLPFLEHGHVDDVFAESERSLADVTFPQRAAGRVPGHPVVFGPRARAKFATLAEGDTIRNLRDDPSLMRLVLERDAAGYFFDVDTPEALERARALAAERAQYPPS